MVWIVAAVGITSGLGALLSYLNLRLLLELHDRLEEQADIEVDHPGTKDAETLLLERLNAMVGSSFTNKK